MNEPAARRETRAAGMSLTVMLKRIVPFIATLVLGIALANLSQWARVPFYTENSTSELRSDSSGLISVTTLSLYSGEGTWAILHSTPTPQYTGRPGYGFRIVRVRVLLGANGQVSQVTPNFDQPEALLEDAVKAAWKIKFTPATKDGQPISVWTIIQYVFADNGFRQSAYPLDDSMTSTETGEQWHVVYE